MRKLIILSVLAASAVWGCGSAQAKGVAASKSSWTDGLELGLRYSYFTLQDKSRPIDNSDNFLGSINKLDEEQNDLPMPFLNYMFCPYGGLSLSYSRVRARTFTKEDGHTDGAYDLNGPTLSAQVRYPNETRFTPYAEAGVAFYNGNFDHDPAWRHVGNDRLMLIDDTEGYLITLGCSILVQGHWSADLFGRYNWLQVVDNYYLNGNLRERQTIPLNNMAWGAEAKYSF